MFAGRSLKLATLFGIRIGVSTSWFLVLFLLLYFLTRQFQSSLGTAGSAAFLAAAAAAAGFFGSILLHELGHALAAKREGIDVAGIDLFIFGGVMKMSREADSAGGMFRIAAAGPAVTLAIVLLSGGAAVLLTGTGGALEPEQVFGGRASSVVEELLALLFSLNVILLVFNLLPALPLDGGQILRAGVWRATGDRARATRVAAVLGQGLAYLLMAYGAYRLLTGHTFDGAWSIALGFLIGQGARAAAAQAAFSERLDGVTVADVMDPEPVTIPAGIPAARAWDEFFERYAGWDWFAVVEGDGRYAGLAHRAAVRHAALEEPGSGELPVRDVVAPADADARVAADAPLESLLALAPLHRLGAVMALDGQGRLRGVVTLEQVSRAVRAAA